MSLANFTPQPVMLGSNKIAAYNADCLEVLDALGWGKLDLVVTDPPYLMSYKTNMRKTKNPEKGTREHMLQAAIGNDSGDEGRIFIRRYFEHCYRALKEDTAMYCFCKMDGNDGEDLLGFFKEEAKRAGFKVANTIIWAKNNGSMGDLVGAYQFVYEPMLFLHKGRPELRGKRYTDLWEFSRPTNTERIHPNQKPVDLLMRAVESSSDVDGLVFDGTAGSGTTAIAAYKCGRKSIVCEYDPVTPDRFQHMVDHINAKASPTLF